MELRSPIIVVLGHVDHGKTSLLDWIRKTSVQAKEVHGKTQHIGASFVPTDTIFEIAKPAIEQGIIKIRREEIDIPGLLFIDTPGHEVFVNLRSRGASLADLAILVVDVRAGFQAQTFESLELLKRYKVPFIIAANKIDRLPGWKTQPETPFVISIKKQTLTAINNLEFALDEMIKDLYKHGFNSDRYDRIKDFRTTVAIVPVCAINGEGIADLLLLLAGLAGKFLRDRLKLRLGEPRGNVLEVRKIPGAGTVIDVILVDGKIRAGDWLIVGGKNGVIRTTIRSLFIPKPLDEIRDPRDRFDVVDEITAAAGVRVIAPNLDDALAGSPLRVVSADDPALEEKIKSYEKEIQEDISQVLFKTNKVGVVVFSDTLGTLETIVVKLKDYEIPISRTYIGSVDKEGVLHALAVREIDPKWAIVIAFNVDVLEEARQLLEKEKIPLIEDNLIFRLFEKINAYVDEYDRAQREKILKELILPAKIEVLSGFIFRRSKPAIVGVRVLSGVIRPNLQIINADGKVLGHIKSIQSEGKSLEEATAGMEVAISITDAVVGRDFDAGDVLYVDLPEEVARKINRDQNLKKMLPPGVLETFRELLEIKRKVYGFSWGL
ncbi:MAG: translation initiation factor IF-2 [Crenarchaeota archaeon]|nr:translation initiation factor IF-2 [Thermoproteota archaeon]MCR8454282.1 translation initiation factor IF-2 [Thermoproteota archaeon]MCR8455050.1 translation initiation factor IF-2 [Thermoproteota archaeon]MCR8463545.1 translation initiation factor IF-2 [Thermoproteota archaeon]MCR8470790.1 translation initiation factor IF-2 [Thermoproteota archaeon]